MRLKLSEVWFLISKMDIIVLTVGCCEMKSKAPSTTPTVQANVGGLSSTPSDPHLGNGARTGARYCSTGNICACSE